MNIKSRMGIYIAIFLTVFSALLYLSKDSNNYISITTNRESIDIFNTNQEKVLLYKKEGGVLKKVPIFVYLNDYMNINSESGEYLVKIKEKNYPAQEILTEKKKDEPLIIGLKYIPKIDLRKNNIFLNVLTGAFLLFNLRLLYNFKKEIVRKKEIIFPIFFLCLKILLTNSELFSNVILTRINLVTTSILGLYLLIYVKNKSYQIKNDKSINMFLWILFIMYYIGEVVMTSAILNSKILNYLATNYFSFLKISIFFYVWIDALIIILFMFLLESIKIKKKQIIKQIEKKNLALIASFIILSLTVEFFINNNKYFYYLNMFEFVYVFWYIFLIDINTMGKVKVLNLKIFQMFLHIYLFFVITESVEIALGVIASFLTLNLYTYFIQGTLKVDRYYIENLINRMYLTKNSKEFKEQLSKELKKNLELSEVETKILIQRDDYKKFLLDRGYDEDELLLEKNDILNKKYDYAVRLKYNKNPFIGVILIANRGTKLVYEEKRYLEEISKRISLIASRYRFEKLQEELN
ncbi:hypothetical protein NON08_05825 [Cetobacterium somerae]|uniref:hypothetical protein n=1 Tax=Cetobacterium sp. NK01 TaxID=2993530 RepID=UPI002116CE69|nr:hypothetical protein [Cetobacterium sp. NK01]MCQ8212041.1 hypothetical protein [Cetobacterium sp. NK01]